ncbi:uncharacterized protein LOC105162583 [Sesamum indicum]|uniref:Uncharacterized protein LOC105162583 n=1 Tax=Sesamum indicum TaxID=4182 RepID=A0A6I9T9I7_SESIN|nr:uncharacterized protein LOC105162583 [Sesamum indicum]
MHHLGVKREVLGTNSDTKNVGLKGKDIGPVCPKPRRLGSTLPAQFLNHPCLCREHHDADSDGRSGILDIIAEKRMDGRDEIGRCNRCWWSGSPPGRTNNPLVHDVHFLQIHGGHMPDLFPPFTSI